MVWNGEGVNPGLCNISILDNIFKTHPTPKKIGRSEISKTSRVKYEGYFEVLRRS